MRFSILRLKAVPWKIRFTKIPGVCTWSGTIRGDDGATLRIDAIDGFAEEARNRW